MGRGQPCGARGSPLPGPKVDWQRFAREAAVSRREMGEGPFGDSDASVEACRDRNLSEWGGRGLLEAKMFGLLQFFAFVGPRWSGEVCGGVKGSHVREIRGPCTPVLFGVKQHRLAKSKHLANSRRFSLVRRCVIVATRPDPPPLTISPPRGRSFAN